MRILFAYRLLLKMTKYDWQIMMYKKIERKKTKGENKVMFTYKRWNNELGHFSYLKISFCFRGISTDENH